VSKPRVLFVGRTRYRLPLADSLARKWDALSERMDLRVSEVISGWGLRDSAAFPFIWVVTQVGGRVTLKTASGQALRLGSRSQLALLPAEGEEGPTRVRLDNGWLWVAVSPNSSIPTQVEVRAGPGAVTVRGAGVGLRRGADGAVLVQVHHGTAVCAGPNRQWERTLTGPQELLIPASGIPGAPVALTVDKLEVTWVKWNADQDLAGGYGGAKPAP